MINKKNIVSIIFATLICFSFSVTIAADILIDDSIAIEQVDERLYNAEKFIEHHLIVMDSLGTPNKIYTGGSIIRKFEGKVTPICDIKCNLEILESGIFFDSLEYRNQGLIWKQKLYYNSETKTIYTKYIIELGISQYI